MDESLFDRLVKHKVLYVVLGLIIIAEVIWAGWVLIKSDKVPPVIPVNTQTSQTPTTISLTSDKQSVKAGEKVVVDIVISSEKLTDGTDVVINFDPNLLSAATASAGPVKVGALYSEYPFNKVEGGNISVSGIAPGAKGIIPNGLFGAFDFIAKKPGLAKISLLYTKDSTKNTIVVESGTGKNILEKVNDLEINILP